MALFWAEPMLAQSDSSRLTSVDSLVISARTNQPLTALKSLPVNAYLSEPVTLRTQGPGQIASISIPGFSSRQTDFIWNGFSLQSPSGISVDFGQVPLALFDQTQVVNNNPVGENGISGKGVLVRTNPILQSSVQAQITGGSFGYLQKVIRIHSGTENYRQSYRLLLQRARNNFPIPDRNDTQTHAATSVAALVSDHQWNRTSGTTRLDFWFQSNTMEIPPSVLEASSEARRSDQDLRASHETTQKTRRGRWEVAQLVNAEWDRYVDPKAQIESPLHFVQFKNRIAYHFSDSGWLTSKLLMHRSDARVKSPNIIYNRWFSIQTFEGEATARHSSGLSGTVNLKHLYNRGDGRLAPAVSVNWKSKNNRWKAQVKADERVRFPLLSDLYWFAFNAIGNPDLKTESVRSLEATVGYEHPHISIQLNGYQRNATDLINWLNTRDGVLFPVNQDETSITGGRVTYSSQWGNLFKWRVNGHYQYNQAIDMRSKEQRLFTPLHQGATNISISYAQYSLGYSVNYQSEIYLNTRGTDRLPGYLVHQIHASGRINKGFQLGLSVNNLLNQYYELSPNFPMPGRAIYITIKYNHPINT